jgi:hypothetical protein
MLGMLISFKRITLKTPIKSDENQAAKKINQI